MRTYSFVLSLLLHSLIFSMEKPQDAAMLDQSSNSGSVIRHSLSEEAIVRIQPNLKVAPHENNQTNYNGIYYFKFSRGLVRIKNVLHTNKIEVKRWPGKMVCINALLNNSLPQPLATNWFPWEDDVVRYVESNKDNCPDEICGGNRLALEIKTVGNFTLYLPRDADLEVACLGDVKYRSSVPTKLHLEEKGIVWDLYWGSDTGAVATKLISLQGKLDCLRAEN